MGADLLLGGHGAEPLAVADGGDFTGAYFGFDAPEDGGVEHGDAAGGQVGIDGCFVSQHFLPRGGVDYAHNLSAAELAAAAAPVAVGHADMAAAFSTGAFLHAGGHGPVEEVGCAGAAVAFLALGGRSFV